MTPSLGKLIERSEICLPTTAHATPRLGFCQEKKRELSLKNDNGVFNLFADACLQLLN